jgi:hypothetical protein
MVRKGTDPVVVEVKVESKPKMWLTFLVSIVTLSIIHGLLTPLTATTYGKLFYSTLLSPMMQIWGIYYYASFAYPDVEFLHASKSKRLAFYILFSLVAVSLGALRSFKGDTLVWTEGVYSGFVNGIWVLVLWRLYTDPDNVNATWLKYCVPPLYVFSFIYDIGTSFPDLLELALFTSTLWIVYSGFVCILIIFIDQPVDFFRRKINHVTKGWVDYTVNNDGSYFSFFVFMLFSVGPGAGILLSYCNQTPLYWDPTMKTLALQAYAVGAINIAEITTARMSDEWLHRAFMISFVTQLDIIQAALFTQTEAFDWNFLKMTMAVQFSHMFRNSSLKEAFLWLIGGRPELPYIDRPKNQVKRRISIDFRLEFFALLAAYMAYVFEDISMSMDDAPEYQVTYYNETDWSGSEETTVMWQYTASKCAVTCVGWREDWGVSPLNMTSITELPVNDSSAVLDTLAACLLFRFIFSSIEARIVNKVYRRMTALSSALQQKTDMENSGLVERETTVKFSEINAVEFKAWLSRGLASVFLKELGNKNVAEYAFMKGSDMNEEELQLRGVFDDSQTLRKDLVAYVDDGKEFGVEVTRMVEKVKPPLKKTVTERQKDGEAPLSANEDDDEYGPDLEDGAGLSASVLSANDAATKREENAKKGASPIESAPFMFLLVSLWFAVSSALGALQYSTTLGLALVDERLDVKEV